MMTLSYSRIDQVEGCLSQIVLDPFLNTFSHARVFSLRSLLFHYKGGRAWVLRSGCKTDYADFTD